MSTVEAVIQELCRNGSRCRDDLPSDQELLSSGLLDSLGLVGLVSWIEDSYDLTIDVMDIVMENFETPAAIAALIDQLQGQS